WTADLPHTKSGEGKAEWHFRQLFVGGERQIRARTPNFDPEHPTTGGWCFVALPDPKAKPKGRRGHSRTMFRFRPGDVRPWPKSPDPEIHIFPAWGWVNAILSVERIDAGAGVVHVTNRNCSQELRPGNRYFVENVFEALDAPGEWYLDRRLGRLHYRPKEADFAKRGAVAPRLDRIIDIAGRVPPHETEVLKAGDKTRTVAAKPPAPQFAEHIVIRGFTFRHTTYSLEMGSPYTPDDGAVWLRRARRCVVEGCQFPGIGGYAVRLSMRARENHIIGNTVKEAGQGGVLLVGYDTATQPRGNVIAGNHITHCGAIWKHVAGVYVTTGGGNRIAHNTITDVPRYGVSLKSFGAGRASHGNVIEFNRLVRTNLETNDTGAIETLGRDREDTGNIIRGNLILDAVGFKTTETGEMLTPFYTWGIYLDDYSSGTTITGNIVARTYRGGMHVHLGRNNVFEHNIFVDGEQQQAECNGHDFMANNVFRHNIVVFRQGSIIRVNRWHDKVFAACDHNLYWRTAEPLAPDTGGLMPKGSISQWQAAGYDTHSVIADPLFVDAAKDDYRLKPDSPALKLGFQQTDISKIGVAGYKRPGGLP
ncbi:right-handed parallel beta-helix repeat-containing protein, partial [bacterium]|nr:right-handed parallel beta-helix repeat-containing protein [bacterium]